MYKLIVLCHMLITFSTDLSLSLIGMNYRHIWMTGPHTQRYARRYTQSEHLPDFARTSLQVTDILLCR